MQSIRIVRVYDEPGAGSPPRVLVDRLWPRGIAKGREPWDHWLRDVAPSDVLRKWYGHDERRFAEFRSRYLAELRRGPTRAAWEELRELAIRRGVRIVTATKAVEISAAQVLAVRLRRSLARSGRR